MADIEGLVARLRELDGILSRAVGRASRGEIDLRDAMWMLDGQFDADPLLRAKETLPAIITALEAAQSMPTDKFDSYVAGQYLFNALRTFLASAAINASDCNLVIELPDRDAQRHLVSKLQRDTGERASIRSAARIGNHSGKWQGVDYEFSVKGWREAAQSLAEPSEEMVEKVARAVYVKRPMRVISEALVQATGLPLNSPVTYDQFKALGGDDSGTRQVVRAAIAAITTGRA